MAVAGAAGIVGGTVGSINATVVGGRTAATIEASATVNADLSLTDVKSMVVVLADHETSAVGIVGSAAAGLGRSIGAALDSVIVDKAVVAQVAGTVQANGTSRSARTPCRRSARWGGTADASIVVGLAAAAALHVVRVSTEASVGASGVVLANGSVQVAADDRTRVRTVIGSAGISVVAAAGGAVAAVLLEQTSRRSSPPVRGSRRSGSARRCSRTPGCSTAP